MYRPETIRKLNEKRSTITDSCAVIATQSIHSGCTPYELGEARKERGGIPIVPHNRYTKDDAIEKDGSQEK